MTRAMKDSGIEWIGKIPENWKIIRIKFLADKDDPNSFIDGDWIESPYITKEGIRYLTTGNVGDGVFKQQGDGYITEETFTELNCKYAFPGDLVFSRLNEPYGRSCILPNNREKYVLAVDIVILRTSENKKYISYVTQCNGYQKSVEDLAKGTTMKRISRTNLGNITIPLPPINEQQRIASFLDSKCQEIDNVLAKTRSSIEEYKKLKQAIITKAVTKGIRSNRKMKDSGIELVGEIPEEWEIVSLKFLCSMQAGKNITAEQISPEGKYPVYGGNGIRGYFSDYNYNGEYLLVGRQGALCGNVHRVNNKFWATEHAVLTMPTKWSNIAFLFYLIIAMNLNQYADSAAQPGLSVGNIQNKKTCLVPLCEQRGIAEYLDSKCSEIDTLISKKEQLITELEAYKKSLIYEYVTGKKEVPAI